MTEPTYDQFAPRSEEPFVVATRGDITEREEDFIILEGSTPGGWSFGFGVPNTPANRSIAPGDEITLEVIQGTRVVGARRGDVWLYRKSDHDLRVDAIEFRKHGRRRHEEQLEANRADWKKREAKLPKVLRARLERFRANGGEEFDLAGWGYELVVCELVVLYKKAEGQESKAITVFAEEQGTSNNQHEFARVVANGWLAGHMSAKRWEALPSAFTPISGDPFYLKAGEPAKKLAADIAELEAQG
jgi:hypothetical protein